MLGLLLFLSGIVTALIPLLGSVILALLSSVHDLRVSSLLTSLILFAPASVLMGTIPPYAARLMITDVGTSGSTVGRLSALGSIVGTFLIGYVLLALVENTMLLILLAATLILASFLALGGEWMRLSQTSLVGLLVFAIVVASDKREARRHGHITYRLSDHFVSTTPRALLVGGGAYTVARDVLRRNPSGRIDVAKIDPQLTPKSFPRIRIPHRRRSASRRLAKHHLGGAQIRGPADDGER